MTGLIWKDVLVLRKSMKFYLLFIAFYGVFGLLGLYDITFITSFMQVMLLILPLSLFSLDQAARWDGFAATLPLSRRSIVGARYLFVLLLAMLVCAINLALLVLVSILSPGSLGEAVAAMMGSLSVGLIMPAFLLPLNYKFGPEHARIFLFLLVGIPMAIFFLSINSGVFSQQIFPPLSDSQVVLLLLGLLAAALVFMAVSYLISCRIYLKKEF